MEKCRENERLRDELKVSVDHSKKAQETYTSKLEMLSLEHHRVCEEVEKLQMELSLLVKEREDLSTQIRKLNNGLAPLDEFKNLEDQLRNVTSERDRLMSQIKGHQDFDVGGDQDKDSNDGKLFELKADVEKLTKRLSYLEIEKHNDDVRSGKEKAKLRMRLKWTQAKLDAFRFRHKEAVDELDFMNGQYKAASGKLKEQLASYVTEVLNLKKELASVRVPTL